MLDEIVEKTQKRLVEAKNIKSLDELKKEVSQMEISKDFPFKEALKDPEIAIIAEVKRASPSKGIISEDFDYVSIAKEYESAGASAISVLTEPYFFKGSNDYLKEISENVSNFEVSSEAVSECAVPVSFICVSVVADEAVSEDVVPSSGAASCSWLSCFAAISRSSA